MALTVTGEFRGIEEVRADLEAVEEGLGKLILGVARNELAPVVAEMKGLLPFDPTHRGWRGEHKDRDPGHIRDSLLASVAGNALTISTSHPGTPVHWWGGVISPRGAAIEIHAQAGAGAEFTSAEADKAARSLGEALERLLRAHRL